jgi:hypothetical protein
MYKLILQYNSKNTYKVDFWDRHIAKSCAGKLFHFGVVRSVCVAEKKTGEPVLYMNKERPRDVWVGAH